MYTDTAYMYICSIHACALYSSFKTNGTPTCPDQVMPLWPDSVVVRVPVRYAGEPE